MTSLGGQSTAPTTQMLIFPRTPKITLVSFWFPFQATKRDAREAKKDSKHVLLLLLLQPVFLGGPWFEWGASLGRLCSSSQHRDEQVCAVLDVMSFPPMQADWTVSKSFPKFPNIVADDAFTNKHERSALARPVLGNGVGSFVVQCCP